MNDLANPIEGTASVPVFSYAVRFREQARTLTACARLLLFGAPGPADLAGISAQLADVARSLDAPKTLAERAAVMVKWLDGVNREAAR